MNYCADIVINANRLYNEHEGFAFQLNTSYPRVLNLKGGKHEDASIN